MKLPPTTSNGFAALSALVLLSSGCATAAPRSLTTHVMATQLQEEHDEEITPKGTIDYYPDKANFTEVVLRGTEQQADGGLTMVDFKCEAVGCQNFTLKSLHSPAIPDGDYRGAMSDDPKVAVLRDGSGERLLGYWVANHGGQLHFEPTLDAANTYEHAGDTGRTIGKVALYAVLGVAVVAVVGAAAVAANTSTTHCTWKSGSSTCTTY